MLDYNSAMMIVRCLQLALQPRGLPKWVGKTFLVWYCLVLSRLAFSQIFKTFLEKWYLSQEVSSRSQENGNINLALSLLSSSGPQKASIADL